MKKLGVVIPVWNKEKYIEECVGSVLEQDINPIELVLVNDGSTDNSGNVCDNLKRLDNRIKVIHQEHTGPILARYKGVKELNTEYVTFVDADDWIGINTYQELLPYMKKGIDVIEYNMNRYYGKEKVLREKQYIPHGEYDRRRIRDCIFPKMIWDNKTLKGVIDPSLCNKIFKRDLLVEAYSNTKGLGIHYGEDVAIVYPIMTKCDSYFLAEEGDYYHRKENCTRNGEVYMQNPHFFTDLSVLYEHLLKEIAEEERGFVEQIDSFFMYSVRLYMRKYNNAIVEYMFPFHLVPKGSKIVLYGAGMVGQFYYEEVRRIPYCEVVLWVDKREIDGVSPISEIKNVEYDFVVVAVKKECMAKEIECELVELGVKKRNIIWSE